MLTSGGEVREVIQEPHSGNTDSDVEDDEDNEDDEDDSGSSDNNSADSYPSFKKIVKDKFEFANRHTVPRSSTSFYTKFLSSNLP